MISTTSPSINTILRPSTLFVVTPYFRQCAPPGSWRGCRERARELAGRIGRVEEAVRDHHWPRLVIPASTRAMRLARSTSGTRFIFDTPTTMASSAGSAPPHSDVPAPRATTLSPFSWQYRRTFATSSMERGSDSERHAAV